MGQWLFRSFSQVPYAVIGVAIALLFLVSQPLGLLESIELSIYDYWVRQAAPQSTQLQSSETVPEIVVVGITETDLQNQAQWPLSDQILAELLDTLQQQSPRAIGLDLHRDIAYPPGETALAAQLSADNVFAIESLIDGIPPPPGLSAENIGFNDLLIDTDGVVRRNFFYATLAGTPYYSLSLRMALFLLGQAVTQATQSAINIGPTTIPVLSTHAGGYSQVDNTGYQTLLQYRQQGFRQVSLTEVLKNNNNLALENTVVLIGTVAPSIKDTFFTPFSPAHNKSPLMPGVVIHAHNLSQLLNLAQGQMPTVRWFTTGLEGLWILVWAVMGGYIAWRHRQPLLIFSLTVLTLILLIGLCRLAFSQQYWLLCATPLAALLLSMLTVTVYKVFYYSYYDPMTQLPNRALFLRRLQPQLQDNHHQAAENGTSFHAVLLLDIDGFKSINDSMGQEGGNRILCQVAYQLQRCLPNALVARVGGDEFAVLLCRMKHSGEAADIAAHLQKILTTGPSQLGTAQPVVITVSVGIALQSSGSSYLAANLLQDAHRANYRARQLGRENYAVFARGMRTQAVSQFQLEMDLRRAIEQQVFKIFYQPIIDLATGQISGFEALIRWPHDTRGFISPGEFIPIAEETGLIIPLGKWILQTACAQIHQWHKSFPQRLPLSVSVNLSGRQFNQTDLVESIQAVLLDTQLQPSGLKLELTESVAMENVNLAIDQLLRLKQMGLQISLDDFGTGYSSLSYLHRFSIDTLKVDRSFVNRMEAATEDSDIVHTIINLGHQLGMTVVAEGIETESQLQHLRQLGCDYGQGYFFAKPLNAQQATELLQRPQQW
ncbi:MAG: EAL domain-containing protein [Cyanobacteria bacterium J06632_22]